MDLWESIAVNSFLEALAGSNLAPEIRKRGATTLGSVYRDDVLLEGFMKASEAAESDFDEYHGRRSEQVRAIMQVKTEMESLNMCCILSYSARFGLLSEASNEDIGYIPDYTVIILLSFEDHVTQC
jgi:hypothetical protein